jgi:hypothetical protein
VEERAGLRGNHHNGIFFSEQASSHPTVRTISVKKNRQNFTLAQIKDLMAAEAVSAGANAIVEFKYGQRSHKWYQHLLIKWDTESWYGEGRAVVL